MGRRLVSKAHRVNASGEMLVNFSADRDGGIQVGHSLLSGEDCVPFSNGAPLADRKYVIIAFPTDDVNIGRSPVSAATSYISRGTKRGGAWTLAPAINEYSSRRQFLRGQYLRLCCLSSVQICAEQSIKVEEVTSLETS